MDNNNTFDLSFWAKKESVAALKSSAVNNQVVAATRAALPTTDLYQQVDALVSEVVNKGIDLTQGYENWRNISFALSEGMGNQGRGYFHTLSAQNPNYNETECDKQYDACLNAHGSGITINSLFHAAKEAGIDISAIARQFSTSQTSSQIPQFEECGEMEAAISMVLPTFSDKIPLEFWPKLMQPIFDFGRGVHYNDMMLLGLLCMASGIIPKVKGRYYGRSYYANFYVFIIAPPASMKGDLTFLLNFVKPVQDAIQAMNDKIMAEYEQKLAEHNAMKQNKGSRVGMEPKKPAEKSLFIPGNCSATAFIQTIAENQELGVIMFETEGDPMGQACRNKEWGDFSTSFRMAAHHETIRYRRRTDNENVMIRVPRLTVLMSMTHNQVVNIIPTAEDGTFSRVDFKEMPRSLVWQDVFQEPERPLEEVFEEMGKTFYERVYIPLSKREKPLMFIFQEHQKAEFNATFEDMQNEESAMSGDDIVASVRRLALSTFRKAMVLSVLRLAERDVDITSLETLECDDRDFRIAMEMSNALISHATSVYTNLLNHPQKHYTAPAEGMSYVEKMILEKLSKRFTRQEYLEVAKEFGVPNKTADRYCGLLVNRYKLTIRIKSGTYEMLN